MRARIAAVAARIMAEDGVDDFALAKRKAARQLGAAETEALPANDEVEAELHAYRALYQPDEHAAAGEQGFGEIEELFLIKSGHESFLATSYLPSAWKGQG